MVSTARLTTAAAASGVVLRLHEGLGQPSHEGPPPTMGGSVWIGPAWDGVL